MYTTTVKLDHMFMLHIRMKLDSENIREGGSPPSILEG